MSNKAHMVGNKYFINFLGTIWLLYASWIDYMVQSFSLLDYSDMLGIWCIVTLVQNPYFFWSKRNVRLFLLFLGLVSSLYFKYLVFWYENINIISYWTNLLSNNYWDYLLDDIFFLTWFKENRISKEKLKYTGIFLGGSVNYNGSSSLL